MKRGTNRQGEPAPLRPDREGKRFVAAHVDEATHRDVRVVAAEKGTTVDAIMTTALARYLKAEGRRPSPDLKRKLQDLGMQ